MNSGIFRWQGNGPANKTNWADGRNWVDENGLQYPEDVYPGSGLITNAIAQFDVPLAAGAQSPAGIDLRYADCLRALMIGAAYDGSIGSAESYVAVEAARVHIDAAAMASCHLRLTNENESAQSVLVTGGVNIYLAGEIHGLRLTRGSVTIANNTTIVGECHVGGSTAADLQLTIASNVTLPVEGIVVGGGQVTCSSRVPLLVQRGGIWTQAGYDVATGVAMDDYIGYGGELQRQCGHFVRLALRGATVRNTATINSTSIGEIVDLTPDSTLDLSAGLNDTTIFGDILTTGGSLTPPVNTRLRVEPSWSFGSGIDHVELQPQQYINTATTLITCRQKAMIVPIAGVDDDVEFALFACEDQQHTNPEPVQPRVIIESIPATVGTVWEVWGSDMPNGKPYLFMRVTNNGQATATVYCLLNVGSY